VIYFLPGRRLFLGALWHCGQKWLLRPATISRRITAPHRAHFFPLRWYTRCRS